MGLMIDSAASTYTAMPPRDKAHSLMMGRVIGDVVDPFTTSVSMKIKYGDRGIVITGCEFKPSVLSTHPIVRVGGEDLRNFFTLVMVDPDAPNPSNPTLREYLHWLVTDIPETLDSSYGRVETIYESPLPEVGVHRFVFVLYKQLGRQTVAPADNMFRQNFSTREFAINYNLGSPVAVEYYNSRRESGTGGRRFQTLYMP
ncbi:Protein HEADING DATE 3B [Zostera marina]|uniref:Protein HEADING DATE 3B n=1 Tax=Zostera marina TaxID=29655 RepID=A0A0K9NI19_ZOSMR|nr:Protein HEADING DATE 3B [Zostera marina]